MLAEFFEVLTAERIATISAIVGGVASILIFLWNQHVQARETMLARYDAVTQSYIDYQQICLENPELETSAYKLPAGAQQQVATDPISEVKRKIHFDILTSMFERAFLTYLHAPLKIRRSQWPGWRAYIEHFAAREDYQKWWRENVSDYMAAKATCGDTQYDIRFERFMKRLIEKKVMSDEAAL